VELNPLELGFHSSGLSKSVFKAEHGDENALRDRAKLREPHASPNPADTSVETKGANS
jgi:hypothetical protein